MVILRSFKLYVGCVSGGDFRGDYSPPPIPPIPIPMLPPGRSRVPFPPVPPGVGGVFLRSLI